jgi:acetoacetate decarboxylase
MGEHGAPRTSREGVGDLGDSRRWPTLEDIVAGGFSTPWDAPLVPPFPFTFRNAEVLTLAYRTVPAAIEALLPPPLEPTGDAVMIHVYRMRDVEWIGAYGECNVMVGAQLSETGERGAYSPYLFLDTDVGVAHGREVHGQPKKWAEPKLEARGDLFVGTVTRNGIDVITGTLPYKQRRDTLDSASSLMDFSTNINLKAVDHIDGRPAIRQLTSRRLGDLTVHECWGGPCTVELRPNAQAPVYKLPVKEMLGGLYWRADFTLVPGRVLYDYLEPPAKGAKQSNYDSASMASGSGARTPEEE